MELPVYIYFLKWKLLLFADIFMKIRIFSQNFKDLNQIDLNFSKSTKNTNVFHLNLDQHKHLTSLYSNQQLPLELYTIFIIISQSKFIYI